MDGDTAAERRALIAAIAGHEEVMRRSIARGQNPLFDSGLTMQQLRVLLLLGGDEPLAQGDLAQALGVGMATVTGLVNRLVRRGLVQRTPDPTDRRVHRTTLSPAGRDLLAEIQSVGEEMRTRLLDRIDLDALRALERGVSALRAALESES